MTSQPQPLPGLGPNENAADNAAKPMPLDRSSAEWRSQFGVLPSPLQPNTAMTAPPRNTSNNTLSILAGIVGIIVVAGLIGYGYRPSQQDAAAKNSSPKQAKAILTSGSSIKKLRDKVHTVSPPAAARTRVPAPEKAVSGKRAVKMAVKPAVKSTPRPRRVVKTPSPNRAAVAVAAPRPQQVPRKTPVVRKTPAAAVVAAAALRPERKPAVPAVPLAPVPAIKPREKPAAPPPTPKAARPNPENLQSDGTNPLGLPQ